MRFHNSYIIRGNEEQYVENLIGKDQSTWTDGQMQISYWVYKNISKENLDYLMSLPETVDYSYNGVDIHIAHSHLAFTKDAMMDKINSSDIEIQFGEQDLSRSIIDVDNYIEGVKKTTQYVEASVWTKVMLREIKHEKEQILFFLKFVDDYANSINDSRRPYALDTWEKAYELWSAQCKYKLNE